MFKLRALGIPILGPAYMFGDNKSVVLSSTIPTHGLNKRHNALCFHRVREAIAAKTILKFYHIDGKINPADCETKSLPGTTVYNLLKPWLHWIARDDKK